MLVERFHSVCGAVAVFAMLAAAFIFLESVQSDQHSQLAKIEHTQPIPTQFVETFEDKPCHPHSGSDCQTSGSTTCPHSCGLVFFTVTPEPFDNRMGTNPHKLRPPDPAPGGGLFRPPIVLS